MDRLDKKHEPGERVATQRLALDQRPPAQGKNRDAVHQTFRELQFSVVM